MMRCGAGDSIVNFFEHPSQQRQLRHRGEAFAMKRGWAVGLQRSHMFGGAISHIPVPPILRMRNRGVAHYTIPIFLGDD